MMKSMNGKAAAIALLFLAAPLVARDYKLEGSVTNKTIYALFVDSETCSNGVIDRGSGRDIAPGGTGQFSCSRTPDPKGSIRYSIMAGSSRVGALVIDYPSSNSRQQYKGYSCKVPEPFFCLFADATTCHRNSDEPCVYRYKATLYPSR